MTVPLEQAAIRGTWEMTDYFIDVTGGPRSYPLGPDATGLIVYAEDGYMSVQFSAAGRASNASAVDPNSATPAEQAAAARTYLAYAGPYSVDPDNSVVTHHVVMSLFPNWAGGDQQRHVHLGDNTMKLSGRFTTETGETAEAVICWKRPGTPR